MAGKLEGIVDTDTYRFYIGCFSRLFIVLMVFHIASFQKYYR